MLFNKFAQISYVYFVRISSHIHIYNEQQALQTIQHSPTYKYTISFVNKYVDNSVESVKRVSRSGDIIITMKKKQQK